MNESLNEGICDHHLETRNTLSASSSFTFFYQDVRISDIEGYPTRSRILQNANINRDYLC
jgi:hypothetical protein